MKRHEAAQAACVGDGAESFIIVEIRWFFYEKPGKYEFKLQKSSKRGKIS